ncbi:MAG: AIPR family protein [Corynebacteriales bacterium]|nr:AIPR family protein [Mycobacteriales bacterium]
MDRVTKGLLKTYVDGAGLSLLSESQRFERFVAHIALSKIFGGTFSADDFCVGDGIQGVDAVALSVNGELIGDLAELEDVLAGATSVRADLVFIQAKTSAKFELGDMSVFADTCVSLVTSENSGVLPEFSEMINTLWEHSDRFVENPVVRLFYITTGKWESPPPLQQKIVQTKNALLDSNLISKADFHCWGASEVQTNWRAIDRGLKTTILFENKTTLPEMPEIEQAFLGILPAAQLLELVTDEDGEIRKSLFYDNVRDFQGEIDVNADIQKTLRSDDRTRFCVLNNGVTVVARALRTTGDRFTLEDYQVVNGCQTSHVLHAEREFSSGVHVPFRLIVTADDEVARSITTATNQQTQVSKENLLALLDEQKAIEQYFNAYKADDGHRIFYERRSKQWSGSQQIRGAWRVITLRNLLQSFASIYQKVPHTAARYYSDLRDRARTEVFIAKNHPAYFYSAAYAYCKLDQFFRNEQIDRKFKPARYHLLAGVRTAFVASSQADKIEKSEQKAERALAAFNKFLWDDKRYLQALLEVGAVIDEMAEGDITREFGRNREQTEALFAEVLEKVRIKH